MEKNRIAVDTDGSPRAFNAVSFLRVLAAGMVFLLHATPFLSDPEMLHQHGPLASLLTPSAWGGVWIFFFTSGYMAARGFLSGRYDTSPRGALRFYWRRIRRVWFPTICFLLLCCTIAFPWFVKENPGTLLRFLTCTYAGEPDVDGIMATWYVFTLMWVYLAAPPFAFALRKLGGRRAALKALFCALLLLGTAYRLLAWRLELDWHVFVYTSPYGNLDLFLAGMTAAALNAAPAEARTPAARPRARWIAALALAAVVLLGGYFTYLRTEWAIIVHARVLPAAFALAAALFLAAFDRPDALLAKTRLGGACCRTIDFFASISFGFYLFHSLLLHTISPYLIGAGGFVEYVIVIAGAFAVTLPFAYAFTRLFGLGEWRKR